MTDLHQLLDKLTTDYHNLLSQHTKIQTEITNLQTKAKQLSVKIRETTQAMYKIQEITYNKRLTNINNVQIPLKQPEQNNTINFGKLHIISHIKSGGKSKYVQLLENNIIKKKYDYNIQEHIQAYNNEVSILKHLENCSFVPKILQLIPEKYLIYMTYCGQRPIENKTTLTEISRLLKILYEEYGVYREEDGKISFKINLDNCCYDGTNYYIIDFGSSNWKQDS
jgi:hypothetical protein